MAGGEGGPSFEATPSWVIGTVVLLIVSISLAVEKLLSYLDQRLKSKEKKPLYEALQKIKEELMLMGFISLLLAVFQNEIGKWCISEKLGKKWLPCPHEGHVGNSTTTHFQTTSSILASRGRRLLAEESSTSSCLKGKVPFISLGVLHNLHLFIFVLAVVHVVTCTLTVLLGEVKISLWRKWEHSIRTVMYLDDVNKDKVIDVRSLTFFRERFEGVDANKRNYVISFFKHLCGLVTKADYEAMRMGFTLTHCNGNQRFNFHKYIVYAYEDDFAKVVSISWFLWLLVVIFLTFQVSGLNIYMWISVITLFLLLVVGTKLEQVITELAIYVAQRHTVILGHIRIQPSDEYFWFNQPRIFLYLIHVILFLNSIGLAKFFSTLFQFGFDSCIMGDANLLCHACDTLTNALDPPLDIPKPIGSAILFIPDQSIKDKVLSSSIIDDLA